MQTLLSTKLNVPPACQALVLRPGLLSILAKAGAHSLTLVSAPPGYGKTTLVSSWLRGGALPFTWLSLDEGDNDPIRFLEYFLTALHQVVPAVRLDILDLLQGGRDASSQTLVTLLINEAVSTGDFFLVLDDFHVLHAPPVLEMLGYLLEHLPPAMHLVLLSRTDPPLPLSRLRARGQLLELRAEQLRFTAAEIARFYDEVMGFQLSAPDVSAIESRTEGWIAGLQLAGLAMQSALVSSSGRPPVEKDPHRFIAAFTGSHAYIMDYLTEEVLRAQPEATRSFLLQTAILDRMCGPLCEAVLCASGADPIDGQATLQAIEQQHLFVIPLDDERRWYRYHHLFKEVLSRRLEVLHPDQIPGLHRRASEWFEQQGFFHEAIQHALLGGDADRTVRLVEQHGCAVLMAGELVTLANWLAAIEPYALTRPWLAMQKAWVLSLSGEAERADRAIAAGEQLLATAELTGEVRTLRGSFAAARAHWANTQGQPDLAAQYARNAIDLLGMDGDFSCALRSVATSLLGDASLEQGKMAEARQAYAEAVQIGRIAGNAHMTMLSLTSLADVCFEQGQLHQAAALYAETLRMADQADGPNSSYAQGVHFGLSKVFYAWNRLDEAAASCERARGLAQRWGSGNLETACLALAVQLDLARGCLEKAREDAAALEERIREHPLSPYWSAWVRAGLARFWLDQGKIEKALFLIRDTGVLPGSFTPEAISRAEIPLDAPIPYRLVPAYLILARLFLASGNPDGALSLSESLLREAETWGWGKAAVELLILRALAFQAKKDTASALVALEKAIALAWTEQSKRAFLDEGEAAGAPMGKLLYQARARGMGGEFVEELLSVMERPAGQKLAAIPATHKAGQGQPFLVEPLSARELEILRCIAEGCSNQEIAGRLVLSPLTVKRHISNIYAKLEAKSRTQAVSLARSLKLID